MAKATGRTVRKVLAALVAVVVAVVALLVLGNGRPRAQAGRPAGPADPQENVRTVTPAVGTAGGPLPSAGASWELELSEADGRYLVGLFYDSLDALAAGVSPPDVGGAPPPGRDPRAAPRLVTH